MTVPFLDIKRQYEKIREELESKALEVMRSGSYIGGKYVAEFEDSLKEYLGVAHAVSCANGTDALALALKACAVGPGDEVITTPFTFFATAEAIASIGAVPVFTDINESDFNIDASKIEARITPRTKAILAVHIFGTPCDMDAINTIAKKYNLKVIEDAAQAIGAVYKGKKIGGLSDITCFSFYPTKNLGAFGDGGMITTNDEKLAVILRALREHGAAENGAKAYGYLHGEENVFSAGKELSSNPLYNSDKYFNYLIGWNSRLDALQAALLNIKLEYLDGFNAARAEIAKRYRDELRGVVVVPEDSEGVISCNHQFAIRAEDKEKMREFLVAKGIGTGAFYPVPLHLQKAFGYLGYKKGDLPVAEKISGETVCLPIFPELTDGEIDEVIKAVKEFKALN